MNVRRFFDVLYEDKTTDVSYTITLENRSEAALENIKVAYQIFYERCEGVKKEKVRQTGTTHIILAPGSTRTFESSTASIRDGRMVTPNNMDGSGGGQINIKDRLVGLYLCVSKKDASGKSIERECMVDDVPEKEGWAAYTTDIKTKSTAFDQQRDKAIERWKQLAGNGSYVGALKLCEYYSQQGDQEETKQWADKARELLKRLHPDRQEAAAKKIDALDQAVKAAGER